MNKFVQNSMFFRYLRRTVEKARLDLTAPEVGSYERKIFRWIFP
jgi:hypothetical protein